MPQIRGRAEQTGPAFATQFLVGVAVAIAWGVFAFGAVYPWAFWPLAVVAIVCGLVGLVTRLPVRQPAAAVSVALLWCLAAIVASILLQLIPLPLASLARISPAAPGLLAQLDITFAAGLATHHALSISPSATRTALALFVAFAVLMLGVARVSSSIGARRFAAIIATIAAIVAVVGIVQRPLYAGRIYGFWAPLMGGRPFGPFVNPNHFAGWMLMALPVTFGLLCAVAARGSFQIEAGWRDRVIALSSRHANQLMLLGGAAIVMSVALVLTMSRSGMVAFVVSVAVTSGLALRRMGPGSRRLAIAACLAASVLFSIASVGAETIAARFSTANPANINERLPIWRDTSAIVRDFWLTGTGLNTYGVATLFYQTAEPGVHLREAHNDYLQLAAEGGVLVTIPVACALVAFAVQVRRRFRGSRGSSYWIRLGAVNGLVAIALQSTVDFSLQMPGNAALFAVLAGLALHQDPPRRYGTAR